MSDLRITRTNAFVIEMMNACIRRAKIGNFIVQCDITRPIVPNPASDMAVCGYTDTGRKVSATLNFALGGDLQAFSLDEAKIQFSHCLGDGGTSADLYYVRCEYSAEEGGILIREFEKDQRSS